jgi:hypothetical protein
LGVCAGPSDRFAESLPFSANDATGGSETELQAVVRGRREDVDLPRAIEQSNYFANIVRRSRAGETPWRLITELEEFLAADREQVWENSWVRFPRRLQLCRSGAPTHLLPTSVGGSQRGDVSASLSVRRREELRVPVSYRSSWHCRRRRQRAVHAGYRTGDRPPAHGTLPEHNTSRDLLLSCRPPRPDAGWAGHCP